MDGEKKRGRGRKRLLPTFEHFMKVGPGEKRKTIRACSTINLPSGKGRDEENKKEERGKNETLSLLQQGGRL